MKNISRCIVHCIVQLYQDPTLLESPNFGSDWQSILTVIMVCALFLSTIRKNPQTFHTKTTRTVGFERKTGKTIPRVLQHLPSSSVSLSRKMLILETLTALLFFYRRTCNIFDIWILEKSFRVLPIRRKKYYYIRLFMRYHVERWCRKPITTG